MCVAACCSMLQYVAVCCSASGADKIEMCRCISRFISAKKSHISNKSQMNVHVVSVQDFTRG